MDYLDLENESATFRTVGQLRELLRCYPDQTMITVCGIPGAFYADESTGSILLEASGSYGLDAVAEFQKAVSAGQEYMDF